MARIDVGVRMRVACRPQERKEVLSMTISKATGKMAYESAKLWIDLAFDLRQSPRSRAIFGSCSWALRLTDLSPVQHTLTLPAPVVPLELGVLRAVRLLLPAGRGIPGLEAWVRQDPAVRSLHNRAATLDPQHRQASLAHFVHEPMSLRQAVLDLACRWRSDLHATVWFEVIGRPNQQSQLALVDASELDDARTYLQALADHLEHRGALPVATAAWIACQDGGPPAQASDWGWDVCRPWATFRLGAVEQLLRWTPSGHFLMGSPETEAGRWG